MSSIKMSANAFNSFRPRNKLQWNLNRNLYIVIEESAFENLSRPQRVRPKCVNYDDMWHGMSNHRERYMFYRTAHDPDGICILACFKLTIIMLTPDVWWWHGRRMWRLMLVVSNNSSLFHMHTSSRLSFEMLSADNVIFILYRDPCFCQYVGFKNQFITAQIKHDILCYEIIGFPRVRMICLMTLNGMESRLSAESSIP